MMKWILKTVKDVISLIRRWILYPVLAFLFPSYCMGCGCAVQGGLSFVLWCPSCWGDLDFCEDRRCLYCSHEVSYILEDTEKGGVLKKRQRCGACRGKYFVYDGVWSLFHYHNSCVEGMMYHFKYAGQGEMVSILGPMLWHHIRGSLPPFDMIVPVPLHFLRLWWRGYNQSYLLAKELSKLSHKDLEPILKRKRFTKSQGRLNKKKRRENLKNAFRLSGNVDIQGKDVLLVDDVFTTGSTVLECARVLKKAGARKIYVTTIAIVL